LAIWLVALALVAVLPFGKAAAQPVYYSDVLTYGVEESQLTDPNPDIPINGSVDQTQQILAGGPEDSGIGLLVTWSDTPVDIIARPVDPNGTVVPSIDNPYIADVLVTVQNVSGADIFGGALAFTRPIGSYPSPDSLIGLDTDSVGFLLYTSMSPNLILPAVLFGSLADQASTSFLLRQVIAGPMPENTLGGVELPKLGVTGFASLPEPGQLTLMTMALFLLAFARRTS
jgi:hypothetical protein